MELPGHVSRLHEVWKAEPHPKTVDLLYSCWQPLANRAIAHKKRDRDTEHVFISISQAETSQ